MRTRRALIVGVVVLALGGILVGCGRSSVRIGWRETSGLRHKTARYRSFDGMERSSFRARSGDTIEVDYEVEVEEGTLTLTLTDPDGEALWEETFQENAADVLRLSAPRDGRYRLRIKGDSTQGAFDVSWQTGTD
jgi:hypothetical protein